MSEDGGPPLKRPRIHKDDVDKLTKEELVQKLLEQDMYIDILQNKTEDGGTEMESEDKLKQQQADATRRDSVLIMRLTTKEQDLQEYLNQIQELKQTKNPATMQLRGMLLDPAVNLMFQRMRKEMESCREKLEQAQNDLAAWKFTPDGQSGKRLMAKCRMLLQENEELGKVISAGRTAKLEGEIALEKKFVEEMKKSQTETDEFLSDMDDDLEAMQSTIFLLQQQLKSSKEELVSLREENAQLRLSQSNAFPGRDPAPYNSDSYSKSSPATTPRDRDSMSASAHGPNMNDLEGLLPTAESATQRSSISQTCTENRTPNDDNVVSSSSPGGVDRNAFMDVNESEPHSTNDSKRSPAPNGDHVAMDTLDEPQSSCEGNGTRPGDQANQCPPSPHTQFNHAPCRTSLSADGMFLDATASSEGWSPPNQSKNNQLISGENQYRTDSMASLDRLQNGLLSKQYDVPEMKTEIAN